VAVLEFFYDFVSPYSYLASTRVEAAARRAGGEVRFRPFLLGGVLRATGNRAPIETPAKAVYMWKDLQRWAARLGVPLRIPERFPTSSILALRCALAAEKRGKLVPFTHAVFAAYWGAGQDIAEPRLLSEIASGVALDGEALVAAAPAEKEALHRQTQEAIDRGSFGAPTLLVGEELFFGNDRLEFAEEALAAAIRRA
jgi:2-hydroxychromene-2-carboxylate isomerase